MQMAYSEEELNSHIGNIRKMLMLFQKVLNDKNIKASDIVYNGDLRKKKIYMNLRKQLKLNKI